MRFTRGYWPGWTLWLPALAMWLLASGCHTGDHLLFTTAGPGWTIREGQALWRPKRGYPELGGELMVARHESGACAIQFTKTPLPLVLTQTTGTNWIIQFPPGRMSFGGRGSPPSRFAWLYLPTLLAGEPLPLRFKGQVQPDGSWRLENARTGETIAGYLAP